jgi:RNA polymerase sigma factor (sigma-70 family)
MNSESSALQPLLERMNQADPTARREFLQHACSRLQKLAATILAGSFPGLRGRRDVDSVVHETYLRLMQALDQVELPTVADFFRFAAHKMRQVLLDMVRAERRFARREGAGLPEDQSEGGQGPEPGTTYDPARLAQWTEFHERVVELPEEERAVFEMHYYLDLSQAEIARLLGLHPRKVSYLWVAATEKIAEHLDAGATKDVK